MAIHNELGKTGEEIACRYLQEIGMTILDRNWRHEKDEVDIIAREGAWLVFAEVKTRRTDFFGDPGDAVDERKQQFLIRAAEAYFTEKDLDNEIRYDIVSVLISGNNQTIRHIRDAFYPTLQE